MIVNDEKIRVYDLDTKQSFVTRVASVFETLPKYLIFYDEIPETFPQDKSLTAVDILADIKKHAENSVDFRSLELPSNDLDREKDILIPWMIYNKQLEKTSVTTVAKTLSYLIDERFFESPKEIENFWKLLREKDKRALETQINSIKSQNERTEKLYKKFQKIHEGLVYTNFVTDRIDFSVLVDTKDTLLEIFNNVILSEDCPFASVKKYYKILKDFIPSEEWLNDDENKLVLRVGTRYEKNENVYKDYTSVEITCEGETRVRTRLITEKGYIKQRDFLDIVMRTLSPSEPLSYSNLTEEEIMGVFLFPSERIDTYVFADLVMNDEIFSSLIVIDESMKATKKKSEFGQPWLYIHFNHPNTGKIAANITQKFVDRSDPDMRDQDPEIFPLGEPYIRVRVKGVKNTKSVENFQIMFSKLLKMYNKKYDSIVDFYREYLPDFGTVIELERSHKKEKISTSAPDIFVENYTRKCTEARMPKVVSEKEAKESDLQVMAFPRAVQENPPHYPSDGAPQKYFICPNPDYPFPGLQINKLSNAKEYPFVPCCFKYNQQNKQGGTYMHYFQGKVKDSREKKQQELIITDKFLGADKFGVLPENLVKLFELVDFEPEKKYIRMGVTRSDENKSSFLSCVLVALHETTDFLGLTQENRENMLVKLRKKMSSDGLAPLARQCAYEMQISELQEKIRDPRYYLEARKFVQLLEEYFDCTIYIFSREKLVLPNFSQGLYIRKRRKKCIFVYEHTGSESDHAKYPQCELIVKWNTQNSEDIQYFFPQKDEITQNISKLYEYLSNSYVLNEKLQEIIFPVNIEHITGQFIDTFGKARQLEINYNGNIFTLITDPMPPLRVPEKKLEIVKIERGSIGQFIFDHKGTFFSQTRSEIRAKIGNVKVYIPVKGPLIPGVPLVEEAENFPTNSSSQLKLYNHNKKMARYLCEYIFWLFSRYINENETTTITDKVLEKFVRKNIEIDEKFSYGKISKTFSVEGGMMKDGKLVVTSAETLKRLVYVLKMYSLRDLKSLLLYHTREVISQYYVSLEDFSQNSTQVLLYGEEAVIKWIHENKSVYKLSSEVIVGQRTPYFFRNKLVGKEMFLAQNVDTLWKAIEVGNTWKKRKYNPGPDIDGKEKKSFVLYSYVNSKNITRYDVGKPDESIKILGYKIDGVSFYTTLLRV